MLQYQLERRKYIMTEEKFVGRAHQTGFLQINNVEKALFIPLFSRSISSVLFSCKYIASLTIHHSVIYFFSLFTIHLHLCHSNKNRGKWDTPGRFKYVEFYSLQLSESSWKCVASQMCAFCCSYCSTLLLFTHHECTEDC